MTPNPGSYLSHPELVQNKQDTQTHERAQGIEPLRLIERRSDREIRRRARVVPYAVVVGRNDSECIPTRTQVGVERFATVADVLPVTVGAPELVAEVHALGDGQATGRVVDLQAGSVDWQAKIRTQTRVLLSGAADGPDRDGRRKGVADEMSRVDRHQPIAHHEPQATVGGLERGG